MKLVNLFARWRDQCLGAGAARQLLARTCRKRALRCARQGGLTGAGASRQELGLSRTRDHRQKHGARGHRRAGAGPCRHARFRPKWDFRYPPRPAVCAVGPCGAARERLCRSVLRLESVRLAGAAVRFAPMDASVAYCVRLCDGRFFPVQRMRARPRSRPAVRSARRPGPRSTTAAASIRRSRRTASATPT